MGVKTRAGLVPRRQVGMSEPKSKARTASRVVPGVYRWRVLDERIGGSESDAYAVVSGGRAVLIDPLPLADGALARLGRPQAIVLTAACHQRSSWRLRRALGVPVHAPRGVAVGEVAGELLEEPDHRYGSGDLLPGHLRALHAPGPTEAMYALWHPPTGTLFLADVLTHDGRGTPAFVPAEYQDDPALTRATVRNLHRLVTPKVLCFEHGPPIRRGARDALLRSLAADREA